MIVLFALLAMVVAGCSSTSNNELVTTITTSADPQQRKQAAETLASRHDAKSIGVIAGMASRNQYAAEALETMTDVFERECGTGTGTGMSGAIQCLGQIKTDRSIYALWKVLTSTSSVSDEARAEAAGSLGKIGTDTSLTSLVTAHRTCLSDTVKVAIQDALRSQGAAAVKPLVSCLVEPDSDWIADVLADIGEPAVPLLTEKLKDERREVRFGAAMALVKMKEKNPEAVAPFMNMLANRDLEGIAQNYPFFIKLGSPGTEPILEEVIKKYGDTTMCVDYLNCGNQRLDQVGRDWANDHGYKVYTAPGSHGGPRWGEGI